MATAPTLVLVPGSFGKSEYYDIVINPLREKGYNIHVLDPPCFPKGYKKGSPPPSMYDDAAFINAFVTKLADNGENVVLVAHSYGGIPTTESLKGVTVGEREKAGQKNGVIRVAYMTCLVPKVGESLMQVIKGGTPPIVPDEDGWLEHTDPEATAKVVSNHLPLNEATDFVKTWGRHSARCFAEPLTHNGYKDVPVSWFFCEDDLCVVPEVQQNGIDNVEESWKGTEREGQKVNVTRVNADHNPPLSHKDEVISWLEGLFK